MIRTQPPEIVMLQLDIPGFFERRVPIHQTKEFYFNGRKGGGTVLRRRLIRDIEAMALPRILYEHGIVLLDEILANGKEHACGFDPWQRFMVQALHTRSALHEYLQFSAHFPGDGFDARNVRLSPFNQNGSVYLGERGRGHLFMVTFGSNSGYFNNATDLHVILKHPIENAYLPAPKTLNTHFLQKTA